MKRIVILLLICLSSVYTVGQCIGNCTNVTATLVDTTGQAWSNATVNITLIPPFGNPSPMLNNGVPINSPLNTVTTNGLGQFTISLDDNSQIFPTGSRWKFSMCPNATVMNCSDGLIYVNGVSQDLSASLSSYLITPVVNSGPTIQRAYKDSEAIGGTGSIYWDTVQNVLKGCAIPPCGWQVIGSIGVPGLNGYIPFNNGGAFGADAGLQWNNTLKTLTATNTVTSNLVVSNIVATNEAVNGNATMKNIDGIIFVDGVNYTTINAAITAAGTTGSVIIPPGYAGVDTITNTNNISIIDLRRGNAEFRIWSGIAPTKNLAGYPEGADFPIRARGPADIWIEHENVSTTTTASLSIGANASVLVAAVVVGNNRLTEDTGTTALLSPNTELVINRDTANEERIAPASWSIVDGTHLSITCTKTHTGTTDIEQVGSTLLTSYDLFINSAAVKAPNNGVSSSPLRIKDQSGNIMFYIPTFTGDSFPYNAVRWGLQQTGLNGANFNYVIRNFATTSQFQILKSTDASTLFSLDDIGNASVTGSVTSPVYVGTGLVPATGTVRLANTNNICYRDSTNTSNHCHGEIQRVRGVTGCATAASVGATCTTVVTWPSTFADSSYTAQCGGRVISSGVPVNGGLTTQNAATATFQTVAVTAAVAQYTNIDCIGVHD